MSICLNMIVKNESAIIERALASIAPWIDAWVICDTGSTDNTQTIIHDFFAARNIPGELHSFPFEDFEQARNQALSLCRASSLEFDYILLSDADMELVVTDHQFRSKLTTPAYMLKQAGGTTSYWNTRLVRRELGCRYIELTHEYLDTAGAAVSRAEGAYLIDHANGSSRSEKIERDCRLLERSLELNPNNARAMFYLANTLRESGRHKRAIEMYERRIAAGGWDEEIWYSALRIADCYRELNDIPNFVVKALAAYQGRPGRAEPIHRLANHYRHQGQNEISMIFCEIGSRIPYPSGDSLFIEDEVYRSGFVEEMSIVGYYCASPARRLAGHDSCVDFTTRPVGNRHQARNNMQFYAKALVELVPNVTFSQIVVGASASGVSDVIVPPSGYRLMNPSLCTHDNELYGVLRTSNYIIEQSGAYTINDSSGVIRTRNYLARFDSGGNVSSVTEICDHADGPARHNFPVDGFEDCRLFRWRGGWWCSATVRDRNPGGVCEIALLELDAGSQVISINLLHGPDCLNRHEKNWVPLVDGDVLYFVYSADPTALYRCDDPRDGVKLESKFTPTRKLDHFRGSSQAIRAEAGGWIYVAHESTDRPGRERMYLHRFVHLDETFKVIGITPPFRWKYEGIEFCAGLARDPVSRQLLASFGVRDAEAWIARISEASVIGLMRW